MSATTVTAVKGALFDFLDASALDVQLQYADNPKSARPERVYLGNVEEDDEELRGFGAGSPRTMEEYVVHLHVEVLGKPSARKNEERAGAIANVVRAALSADPKIGGSVPGLSHVVVSGSEWSTTETTNGPLTTVDLHLSVKARPQ